jgi:hypothetical protein
MTSCEECSPPSEAGALYSKRMPMVEPVFAQIKANRRIDRLNEEAGPLPARNAPIAATHNLLKLYRSELAPAGA